MFSDSVTGNKEIMRELLAALPPSQRDYAKRAAMKIEKAFTDLQRDYPKNAAVALGAAFAIYTIGERIVEQTKESDGGGLIELVS
jgi:hypothetical protein